jgi:hypothetical protein
MTRGWGFKWRTIGEIADLCNRAAADVLAVIRARDIPAHHVVEGIYFFAPLDIRQIVTDLDGWPPGKPIPSPLPAPLPLPFKPGKKRMPKWLYDRFHAPSRAACVRRVEEARRQGKPLTNF